MAATPKWHQEPMVAFDTETTGTNPAEARIVTAAVVHLTPGQRPRPIRWLIDPEVEIPAEAAEVHGWTNDRIAQHVPRPGYAIREVNGRPHPMTRAAALTEIANQLGAAFNAGAALIVHNAAYDLTLTEVELERHDLPALTSRGGGIRGVVDPMVIDKQWDPYRKSCYRAPGCDPEAGTHACGGCRGGKHRCGGCGATNRRLESLCAHYGVRHTGAHDAAADAIAAARLLMKLVGSWGQIAQWRLSTLHEHQVEWRREQSDGLRDFWRKVGNPAADEVDSGWPLQDSLSTLFGSAA